MVLSLNRYDVVRLKGRNAENMLFVALSADHASSINTFIIAPLYPKASFTPIRKMQPLLHFKGEAFIFATNELLSVPRNQIASTVGSLSEQCFEITSALDFLFQGY